MIDPETGLQTFASREAYRSSVRSCPPPTPDDCTVLVDGTRIDTAVKAKAHAAAMMAVMRAGHQRDAESPIR